MFGFGLFDRYGGLHSHREMARAKRLLRRIEELGGKLSGEPDGKLKERAAALRERAVGGSTTDDLLIETFSLVREVAHRQIGLRPFDVQIMGGVVLQRGNIVEMKTGEGKTLVATLPLALHALSGRGAHVVTVNDYLAERDARWMGPVFHFMGLSVGVITEDMDDDEDRSARKEAYRRDITYVTNHELVFDYLRDNLALKRKEQVQRPLNFAVVDEVDLLLLDEAGTPLIISGQDEGSPDLCIAARAVVSSLREGEDFHLDYKSRRVSIHEGGWDKMERALMIDNLAAPEHVDLQHSLHNALLAHAVYQRDVDYILQDDEILLVDDHTGRVSPDKRFSDGLHQALEAKEGVTVRGEDRTLAKVSYQMFFRLYPFLCGMTGTAYSAREEIGRIYGLRVVVVPTNKPVIRIDQPSLVFRTSYEKFEAVVEEVARLISRGRPVLVGTTSVRESEHVSRLLAERGISHTVLNAKDDSVEADIIADAGQPSAVTVSTNMAGRGVDIVLGGNPEKQGSEDTNEGERKREEDRRRIVEEGGLMVIGTGLHESGRIDDQLRGRAGRQGDPGGSRYFLSLDDPIYRRFGERDSGFQTLQYLRDKLRDHPSGEPVMDRGVLRTLHELQRKVEVENEAIRREVLRYDLIVDSQRRTVYNWRQTILQQKPDETIALLKKMATELAVGWGDRRLSPESDEGEGEGEGEGGGGGGGGGGGIEEDILTAFREMFGAGPEDLDGSSEDVAEHIDTLVEERLAILKSMIGTERLAVSAGRTMLSTIDEMWTYHLSNLESMDDAVGLRGYAQLDPLLEFEREAHNLYRDMLTRIRLQTIARLTFILPKE